MARSGQSGLVLNVDVEDPACGRVCWRLVILEVSSNRGHSVILCMATSWATMCKVDTVRKSEGKGKKRSFHKLRF